MRVIHSFNSESIQRVRLWIVWRRRRRLLLLLLLRRCDQCTKEGQAVEVADLGRDGATEGVESEVQDAQLLKSIQRVGQLLVREVVEVQVEELERRQVADRVGYGAGQVVLGEVQHVDQGAFACDSEPRHVRLAGEVVLVAYSTARVSDLRSIHDTRASVCWWWW